MRNAVFRPIAVVLTCTYHCERKNRIQGLIRKDVGGRHHQKYHRWDSKYEGQVESLEHRCAWQEGHLNLTVLQSLIRNKLPVKIRAELYALIRNARQEGALSVWGSSMDARIDRHNEMSLLSCASIKSHAHPLLNLLRTPYWSHAHPLFNVDRIKSSEKKQGNIQCLIRDPQDRRKVPIWQTWTRTVAFKCPSCHVHFIRLLQEASN